MRTGNHTLPRVTIRLPLVLFAILGACRDQKETKSPVSVPAEARYLAAGELKAYTEEFYRLVPRGSRPEILAEGHEWTEGPLWVAEGNYLLYSDIPRNAIYKWEPGRGSSLYLQPSGFTGSGFKGSEPGSNGLLLDSGGNLVLCQHGDRRIVRMASPTNDPEPEFTTLVGEYDGKRLNSPNDAVFNSEGVLYFTDPPYGLPGIAEDPEKELPFQGVYRLPPGGEPELLTDGLSRPNGLALDPDETRLYVSNSDPENAIWMVYELDENGHPGAGRVFYDATDQNPAETGNPDGMKVHRSGSIFATGPGGVLVFSPEGELLGKILTGEKTSNCAFNTDQSALFITADSYVLKLDLVMD